MQPKNLKIIIPILVIFSALKSFAIDPSGARVDYDDDSSDGNLFIFVGLGIIAFIVWVAYQYFSSASERNANRPSKPQRKPVEMYSKEWFDIQRQNAEREDKEFKESMIGCAIGILIFIVIPILVQKCS